VRCQSSVATICEALTGNFREEHVFGLQQAVELYDFYQVEILDWDRAVAPR